jgi:hypothetical protein
VRDIARPIRALWIVILPMQWAGATSTPDVRTVADALKRIEDAYTSPAAVEEHAFGCVIERRFFGRYRWSFVQKLTFVSRDEWLLSIRSTLGHDIRFQVTGRTRKDFSASRGWSEVPTDGRLVARLHGSSAGGFAGALDVTMPLFTRGRLEWDSSLFRLQSPTIYLDSDTRHATEFLIRGKLGEQTVSVWVDRSTFRLTRLELDGRLELVVMRYLYAPLGIPLAPPPALDASCGDRSTGSI